VIFCNSQIECNLSKLLTTHILIHCSSSLNCLFHLLITNYTPTKPFPYL